MLKGLLLSFLSEVRGHLWLPQVKTEKVRTIFHDRIDGYLGAGSKSYEVTRRKSTKTLLRSFKHDISRTVGGLYLQTVSVHDQRKRGREC